MLPGIDQLRRGEWLGRDPSYYHHRHGKWGEGKDHKAVRGGVTYDWGRKEDSESLRHGKISEEVPYISFNGVKHLFSNEVQKEWERVTSRPVGAIELLVGAEVASIFPDKFETKGELVVMKSAFGSGYSMFGTHPELRVEGVQFSEEVKMVRQMRMKVTTQYNHRLTHNFHVSAPNLFCTAPPPQTQYAWPTIIQTGSSKLRGWA